MSRESVTVDEVAHTAAGVSYLQKLDMRMNDEHPPLAKVLAAVPLVVRGARADYTDYSWNFSNAMFNQALGEWVFGDLFLVRWNDARSTMFWARVPMLLLTLALGYALYAYGARLGNRWGGALALSAFATMPAFIAFGPLVITDMAVTLFWVMAIWRAPTMWQSPTRAEVLELGAVLAAAFLSKFSAGLLLVAVPAFALSLRLWPTGAQPAGDAERRAWRRRGWKSFGKALLWSALFVYATYLVLSWNQPTDWLSIVPGFPESAVFRRLFTPIGLYFRGLVGFAMSAGSRPTYFLGEVHPHGVWFYFPILFVLKSPISFLLTLLVAVGVTVVANRRWGLRTVRPEMELRWRAIWVSLVVFAGACLMNRLNISIRHFAIPMVLMMLMLAPLPELLKQRAAVDVRTGKAVGALVAGLAACSVLVAVRTYPDYFPYVNAFGGGRPPYVLVNDSNVDWNQGLLEAESFVERRNLPRVLVDAYGITDPAVYVARAQAWNCQEPDARDAGQWALVSANNIGESRNCHWLMKYPHEAVAGGSMYAVLLPSAIPQAGDPDGPPLPKDRRYLAGFPFDARPLVKRCIDEPRQLEPVMQYFKDFVASQHNGR